MARLFFHVINDAFTELDREGYELSDVNAACSYAWTVIGGIIKDELLDARGT